MNARRLIPSTAHRWVGVGSQIDRFRAHRCRQRHAGEPGVGIEGAKYLASLGVAAVGADTWAEVVPFEKNAGIFEVHQILLPMNGIHILENMNTEEMVKDKAWESLFTLGPARITGAVQGIINPIAIK